MPVDINPVARLICRQHFQKAWEEATAAERQTCLDIAKEVETIDRLYTGPSSARRSPSAPSAPQNTERQ